MLRGLKGEVLYDFLYLWMFYNLTKSGNESLNNLLQIHLWVFIKNHPHYHVYLCEEPPFSLRLCDRQTDLFKKYIFLK